MNTENFVEWELEVEKYSESTYIYLPNVGKRILEYVIFFLILNTAVLQT
jgi:hypothetical protein